MTTTSLSHPKWVNIYAWVTVAITVGASAAGYLQPGALFGTWEALETAGALSFAGPVGLFLARNVGTAVLGIFALTRKNSSLIVAYLVLRIATDGMDCIHNLIADNMPVAIMAAVMCAIDIMAFSKVRSN